MKTEEIVVAVMVSPFFAEIECENQNNSPDDMRRMAYAEAFHHFDQQDWGPFVGDDGAPQLKLIGLYRQKRVVLEDGDPMPEGMTVEDDGSGVGELEAWDPSDPSAEKEGTVTGGESTTVSSEQDEHVELIETLMTCLQTYVEIDDRDRSGQPVTAEERDACRDNARAALTAALSDDDVDESGAPVAEVE